MSVVSLLQDVTLMHSPSCLPCAMKAQIAYTTAAPIILQQITTSVVSCAY